MSSVAVLLISCAAVSFAIDFNQSCIHRNYSVYIDGVCYQLSNSLQKNVSTYCNHQGFQLATIRSADVVKGLIALRNLYFAVLPADVPYFFIQAPNGNGFNYLNMNITNSTDNTLSVNVKFSTGQIPIVRWSGTNQNVASLTDEYSYSSTMSWPFCEILSVYEQKGCDEWLSSTNTSFAVESLQRCVDNCSTYIWCAGVNFNWQQNLCQLLADNTSTKNLTANFGWFYFERR